MMEISMMNRLKNLQKEKNHYRSKLSSINPKGNFSDVDKLLRINFTHDNFNKSDKIQIKSTTNGIEIYSDLNESEHRYIFLVETKEIHSVKNFILQNEHKLNLKFLAFKENEIEIELHLILIMNNNNRTNIKVTPGNHAEFDVLEKDGVGSVKVAIRVKGNGYAYIHSPYIYSKDIKRLITNNVRKYKKIKDMNVIFIGDEFTTRSFEPEFNLIKVTPENWKEELANIEVDFFLCESAWLGNNGAWTNKIGTKGPRNHSILLQLVNWCNEQDIPTAFWNKEDPFHFHVFIETARYFDYVFTTDSNSIEQYKANGCKNVYSFPFAAQPMYHNPIEKFNRKNKVVFAGAYYGDKFPERKQVMDNMIEVSGEYGLEIYDRNYNNPDSPNQFPDKFKDYIVGTLKGNEIEKAYKGYKLALNVNSIVDSPTMFARRVFEIIASNTPVVSSESLGINNLFGDLIVASNSSYELKQRIDKYFTDDYFYKTNKLLGLRKVLKEHTYEIRIKSMLREMDISYIEENLPVTVVSVVKSQKEFNELMIQYTRQEWKDKKLVILLDMFEGYLDIFNANNNEEVKTYLIDYLHNYSNLNDIIDTDYFAVFDMKHYYGDCYLTDMILTTKYVSDSHIVKEGRQEEYTFITDGQISRSLIRKKSTGILKPVELQQIIEHKELHMLNNWFKYGARFFNVDGFNFINNYKGKKNINKKIKEITI